MSIGFEVCVAHLRGLVVRFLPVFFARSDFVQVEIALATVLEQPVYEAAYSDQALHMLQVVVFLDIPKRNVLRLQIEAQNGAIVVKARSENLIEGNFGHLGVFLEQFVRWRSAELEFGLEKSCEGLQHFWKLALMQSHLVVEGQLNLFSHTAFQHLDQGLVLDCEELEVLRMVVLDFFLLQ